ncbi:MAG: monovalent cation/H(+) antiporter subunit G [Gammaproteobacteria bacterium]|nr:monovalent cation/H(+) antiporter subunit G [Gammaproteobacteria bacterium]
MIESLSWIFAVVGVIFIVIGAIGLLRMPSFETRVHAASLIDVLGASLIIVSVILQYGWSTVSLKLILIILFLVITSPAAIHAFFNIHQSRTTE